ncbi:hypothetical protein D3C75_1174500 [compost metagenome]
MKCIVHPDAVAFDHRLVQAVNFPQLGFALRSQLNIARNEIAGRRCIQDEDKQRSRKQNDEHVQQSFCQIGTHDPLLMSRPLPDPSKQGTNV